MRSFKPPVLKSCCFFASIETGLVVWGCFKMFIDSCLLMTFKVILFKGILSVQDTDYVLRPFRDTVIILTVILSVIIIDFAQHAILVIAALKRNIVLLTEYYIFTLFGLVFMACVGIFGIYFTIRDLVHEYSSFDLSILCLDMAALILYLGSQTYISLVVRSEIIEIKTKNILTNVSNESDFTKGKNIITNHTYEDIMERQHR